MLKTIKTLSFAAAFSIAGSLAAQAVTFDFATLADTIGESTWDTSTVSSGWTVNGLEVDASAFVIGSSAAAYAYLDSDTAGLGVCSGTITTSGQCDPSSDDNVGVSPGTADITTYSGYERLNLDFSLAVSLASLTLRDAGHALLDIGEEIFLVNNTTGYFDYFYVGVSNLLDWGLGTSWSFEMAQQDNEFPVGSGILHNSTEFYIAGVSVSPVPLPAGGLLLLTALGGMAVARRRRKAA